MIKKLNYEKSIYIIMMILIIGIPTVKFISYALYLSGIISDPFNLNHVSILWGMLPINIAIYIYSIVKKKNKIYHTDIIIFILLITAIISTIFAIDVKVSIIGEYKRDEGLISLFSYYFIFLNCKNLKNDNYKFNLIKTFLTIGIIQVIYSILQIYTGFNFIKRFSISYMAMGLCGNPNFLGSEMVLLTLITFSLYLTKKQNKYLFLTIIYFIGLCLAQSTGPFIGVVLAMMFFLFVFKKQYKISNGLFIIFILIITFYITNYTSTYVRKNIYNEIIDSSYNIKEDLKTTNDLLFNKKYKDFINNYGSGRIEVWKNLSPMIDDCALLGCGLDNVKYIYPQNGYLIYDKAHNVYLQIELTNGILALIVYCILCLDIFIKGFKLKNPFMISLYIAFIGYSIQAFANISVIDVTPFFFMIIGLLYTNLSNEIFDF